MHSSVQPHRSPPVREFFLSRLLRSQPSPEVMRDGGTNGDDRADPRNCVAGAVWIEPASERACAQTLLQARQIEQSVFTIGRRGSLAGSGRNARIDYLVSEHEPFLVSKRHCAIERVGEEVWVRDLGSRLGTLVNGIRLGGGRKQMKMQLPVGEHDLVLGPGISPLRFKVIVQSA